MDGASHSRRIPYFPVPKSQEDLIRALITGATGFIGRNLVRHLLDKKHDVHVLLRSRGPRPPELEGAVVHTLGEASGTQGRTSTGPSPGADISSALEKSRPEVVFHLASLFLAEHKYEQIEDLCQSNLAFGTQLVDAMLTHNCAKLVSAGTAWQNFNGKKGTSANLYAATKEAFEVILRYYADARGLQAKILKLNDTYGPGDPRPKLLAILRRAACSQERLGLSPGEQKIDLLHVRDVAQAMTVAAEALMKSNSPGVEEYYLRSGRVLSIKELVAVFNQASGEPLNASWGERPYRAREVMTPWAEGPVLPDWKPEISLEVGLREYVKEVSHV